MNIDKKDNALGVEAKFTTFKSFLINEMNIFNELLTELGYEPVSNKLT